MVSDPQIARISCLIELEKHGCKNHERVSMNLHSMAKHIELWVVEKFIPWARNPGTHSDAQIAQIAANIAEFGFNSPILVDTRAVGLSPLVSAWRTQADFLLHTGESHRRTECDGARRSTDRRVVR